MSDRYLVRYEDHVLNTLEGPSIPHTLGHIMTDIVAVVPAVQTEAGVVPGNGLGNLDLSERHLNFQACDYGHRN